MDIPRIQPQQVVRRLQRGARLAFVDARSAAEHATATHVIPGSLRIAPELPLVQVSDALRDAMIVVYCASTAQDPPSGRIALRLAGLGFGDVHVLEGGIQAWDEAGLPLEPLERREATRNGVDHQVM